MQLTKLAIYNFVVESINLKKIVLSQCTCDRSVALTALWLGGATNLSKGEVFESVDVIEVSVGIANTGFIASIATCTCGG